MTVESKPAIEPAMDGGLPFRMVDLSHPLSFHTPGWVGYPGMKQYYTQTLQTNRVMSQRVETSLHAGTHIDAPLHLTPGVAHMPGIGLVELVHEGVVVDISDA